MPCSGCARRRAKMLAAYNAMKKGFSSAKQNYATQALDINKRQITGLDQLNVIDIREKKA